MSWAPDGGAYRATFVDDPDAALTKIFRGIGALSSHELAGERMAVAFESKDQEDEHSCFSDNTNADVVNDLKGIRMVYNGESPGDSAPNGASLATLVTDADPGLAKRVSRALDGSLAQAQAFPATFETMIAAPGGSKPNVAMEQAIEAVETQSDLLEEAAEALGVKVSFGG
jgi:putative iron-regulated protein